MVIFAVIVSVLMAFIKNDDKKAILRYSIKLFMLMAGGVILWSWIMHFL